MTKTEQERLLDLGWPHAWKDESENTIAEDEDLDVGISIPPPDKNWPIEVYDSEDNAYHTDRDRPWPTPKEAREMLDADVPGKE